MIRERVSNIYSHRYALRNMSVQQFKSKYSKSILGLWGSLLNPLLMVVVINFIFSYVFETKIKDFQLFILSGIFPWMFFSSSVMEATVSISGQRGLLRQFNLPIELLPLSCTLSWFWNFLISWVIIYPVFLLFNYKIIVLLPLLVFIIFLNLIFVCGLSLILSVAGIIFRDMEHVIGTLLMFWFWITPVFYSLNMIPQGMRWLFNFNPATPFIEFYREIIYHCAVPGLATFVGVVSWALVFALSGIVVFSFVEPGLLKRI